MLACNITVGQAAGYYLPIIMAGGDDMPLPPISLVEQEVPVDTFVQRLFGSPWNERQAKFLLSCSEPVVPSLTTWLLTAPSPVPLYAHWEMCPATV